MNDISLLAEMMKQIPGIVAIVFVVILFLRHLQRRDEILKTLGDSCHAMQERALDRLHESSRAFGEVTRAIGEFKLSLRELKELKELKDARHGEAG